MKKILSILLTGLVFLLVACKSTMPNVVVSKVYGNTATNNNLIELYNNSDKDVSLKSYKLNFYNNGSEIITNSISLTGTIKANDFFVIGGSNFDVTEHKSKLDFVHDGDLPFNGDDAFELTFKNKVADQVGHLGIDLHFVRNLTLIRVGALEDFEPVDEYNQFNFIGYVPGVFQYLKNDSYEIKTLDDLYAGPQLEERYLNMRFVDEDNETLGSGGTAKVTLVSIADGDTATFRPVDVSDGFPGGNSMRYFYIDTPEVDGIYTTAQPWGYVASKYNKQFLLVDSQDKEIILQSIPNHAITEVNNRFLGLIWVNGYLSQFLITSEGLTDNINPIYTDTDLSLSYKNVPYLTFLLHTENRAKMNGWGAKGYPGNQDGEKSPDWNYSTNKSTTSNPIWQPHLPIPWEN